jgi:NADPH2:quinone reductase
MNIEVNQGDDPAGYVHEVGEGITEFKKGDRVAGFHEMLKPGGSYAEYAVLWSHTTFHIPEGISFEEAATLPLAAITAAVGLYRELKLPQPWVPADDSTKIPLLIWGGSSAVGAFTLQLAKKSNIHPLIVVAGRAQDFVKPFLDPSKGDVVLDYRQGNDAIVKGVKDALKGQKLLHAYDAVSDHGSYETIFKVLETKGGKITVVLPGKKYEGVPTGTELSITSCGKVFGEEKDKDLGFVYSRYFAKGLKEGWFKAHPHEVLPGGLGAVQQGLQNLKDGKASAVKYVFRIEETEGVEKSNL